VIKGFREFILRGNVIDLAVAVVIGAAFTGVVNTLVNSIFNPAIGALFNAESLAKLWIVDIPTTHGGFAHIAFGALVAAVIQFLLVALVVYFLIIAPINFLRKRTEEKKARGEGPKDAPPTELELLTEIRDLLAARKE
jgi:large conductance mechanosensitive channel